MKKKHPERILIINTFGIGDVLFSTPLLRAVKEEIPGASIDFMCNERCQCILQHNKNIDRIIVFEKDEFRKTLTSSKREFLKKLISFTRNVRSRRYDLAIDLSLGHQISLLLKIAGVKERIGFNYRNRGRFLTGKLTINGFSNKHVVDYYLDILKLAGIEKPKEKSLELPISGELKGWADAFTGEKGLKAKRLIGIAPGGGKSWGRYALYRRWDPNNFSSVARAIAEEDSDIFFLIFGSDEERGITKMIEHTLKGRVINLCGKLSLTQSIALIKRCALLLCNDGGILHIAVSQGVDTVSIFGPVDDSVYGPCPPSERHVVVKAESVLCRPCYNNFKHQMCENLDCLRKIDKGRVLEHAKRLLGLGTKRISR
jgi:lipopolysaccharide heptosyltransferase II